MTNTDIHKRRSSVKNHELKASISNIDPSQFTDYRSFLAKIYKTLKESVGRYSYDQFTFDLGLGKSNAMYNYTKGKRALSLKTAKKIAEGLELKGDQKAYFLALVEYQSSSAGEQRTQSFARMLKIKAKCLSNDWDKKKLQFFEHWHHTAIYELLRSKDSLDDAEWISKNLKPHVHITKVRESLLLLKELGLLAPNAVGKLEPTDTRISTGSEIKGMTFKSYHNQMIDLAMTALSQEKAANRDISSVTIGLPRDQMAEVKRIITDMRRQLLELAEAHGDSEQIYQINIQAFPVSELLKRDKK